MILIGGTSLLSAIPQFGQELEVQITYFYLLHCLHKFLIGSTNVPIDILKTFSERSKGFLDVRRTFSERFKGFLDVRRTSMERSKGFFFKGFLDVCRTSTERCKRFLDFYKVPKVFYRSLKFFERFFWGF